MKGWYKKSEGLLNYGDKGKVTKHWKTLEHISPSERACGGTEQKPLGEAQSQHPRCTVASWAQLF